MRDLSIESDVREPFNTTRVNIAEKKLSGL